MFKLVYSDFNKITGISTVTLSTDLGEFTGTAKLHEDDAESASNYFGCQIAETRALIEYSKRKKQVVRQQYLMLKNLYTNISQTKTFDKNCVSARKMRRKIYELHKEWRTWRKTIEGLEEHIKNSCIAREGMLNRLKNKGKNE